MPLYIVTLTNDEIQELKLLIQKGGKGYHIKHAQILLKLDQTPANKEWTYDRIKDAYRNSHWIMQAIADELIHLEVVDYITDSTICEVMKKRNQAVTRKRMVHSGRGC